ncbi:MAG TPA: hypothetical protein VKE22_07555 [Haliangiales bacterium]|nr:hypothetical protein [Haliangiales bacterium]
MPAEPPDPQAKPSSWSRLPASEPDTSPAAPGDRDAVRVIAARAGAAVRDQASQAAKRVGESIRRASSAFASPTGAELEGLLAGVDLPEIGGEGDAVAALALRLDREADFWRGLALRSLARAAWADRVAQIVAVLSGIGGLALAVIAGLGALFGASSEGGRAILILAAGAALIVACLLVNLVSARIRRAQREVVKDALARADLAELRLHRVSVVLAMRKLEGDAYSAALLRLERDAGAPAR